MDLRKRIAGLMPQAWADLAELVGIQSVAGSRQVPAGECERAARWVAGRFADVGFADARAEKADARAEKTADGSLAVVGSHSCGNPDAPTVLLYAHYDVRPAMDEEAWHTPPFRLTQVNGRWYGRGAADCKGNIIMHLTALRALGRRLPVNLRLVVAGAEELGTEGLADFVHGNPDLFRADAILVCDTGNAAAGRPAVTVSLRGMVNVVVTVQALGAQVHSGTYGGPAPDALAALVSMLATFRDAKGNTVVAGLEHKQVWLGEPYPAERFRADAGVLGGVGLLGDGGVADMLWARPALTVLGIDCPPVLGSPSAIVSEAAARLNLRIPPGVDPADAERALVQHLHATAPWGVRVAVETEAVGAPFRTAVDGPAHTAIAAAMLEAYGRPGTSLGQGGSIPLCNVLAATYPDAELILMGVQEPQALVHAPNESVDPGELARMAHAEALFLSSYAHHSQ